MFKLHLQKKSHAYARIVFLATVSLFLSGAPLVILKDAAAGTIRATSADYIQEASSRRRLDHASVSGGGGSVSGGGGSVSGGGGSVSGGGALEVFYREGFRGESSVELSALLLKWIGASSLREKGRTGQGVGVAILDSGISHESRNLQRVVAFRDFVNPKNQIPTDPHGHGTFVADLVSQVSPGSSLIIGRVLDGRADGEMKTLINGLRWIKKNRKRYKIRVLNLSLIGTEQAMGPWNEGDSVRRLIAELQASGVLVVVAAGNDAKANIDTAPANSLEALAVGAFDPSFSQEPTDIRVSSFSNHGSSSVSLASKSGLPGFIGGTKRTHYFPTQKPEVFAPGSMVSAELLPRSMLRRVAEILDEIARTSDLGARLALLRRVIPTLPADSFSRLLIEGMPTMALPLFEGIPMRTLDPHIGFLYGTSFAAPLVAGGVALIAEGRPQVTPERLKQAVIDGANSSPNAPGIRRFDLSGAEAFLPPTN